MKYCFLMCALAAMSFAGDFSHATHAPLKMKCVACHSTAEKEESASFPEIKHCRVCHTSMAEREIPARRIYRVKDFVFFSHARHAAAKTSCATCHGEVMSMAKVELVRPTTMASCVACHKETKASVACNTCHELGQ
jgi:predicted CXXCH cytochrome family protein